MKTFRFTQTETFIIQADNEEEAIDIWNEGDTPSESLIVTYEIINKK